jgi:HEAT repeat protein
MTESLTIEMLLRQLGDAKDQVRRDACLAVAGPAAPGQLGYNRLTARLIDCLSDRDNSVRAAAAAALGRLRETLAVEPLIETSQDLNSRPVREAACAALGELGDLRALETLLDYLAPKKLKVWVEENAAQDAVRKLLRNGPAAPLVAHLNSEGLFRSRLAAERTVLAARLCMLIGETGDRDAVPALIRLLPRWEGAACASALEALGRLGDPRALEPLLLRTPDADPEIRRAASEALGRLRDARAVDALIERLADKEGRVRQAACVALGEIGDKRCAGAMLPLLQEPLETAKAAFQALVRVGAPLPDSANHLIGALEGREEALLELGGQAAAGDFAVVPLLVKHWQQHRSERARKALSAIASALGAVAEQALCPECLTGLRPAKLGTRLDTQMDWFVCRTCGKLPERLFTNVRELVAVLDRGAHGDYSLSDGVLRLNWLERRSNCNFDRVDVVDAEEAQVEVFCQLAGSEMAALHAALPKRIPVAVAPGCTLSRNTLKNLRNTFGPIVSQDDDAGAEERPQERPQSGGWLKKLFSK